MAALPPGIDLSTTPLQANPSGAPPNFVDPPSLLAGVRGVGITLAIVASLLVVIRLTIYAKTKRGSGLDDAAVVIALVLATSYTGMVASDDRLGRHAWDTPLSVLDARYAKLNLSISLFYGPMLFFAKASVLLMYLRVFQRTQYLRVSVYATLVFLFGAYWMTVPLAFVYCVPRHGQSWGLPILSNCDHLIIPGLVQGAANILADLIIFFLPLPVVLKLHVSTGKKIALIAVFMTGLLALISSILTMYFRSKTLKGYDATWVSAQIWICIQAEIYAAIWVACMPALAKAWHVEFKIMGVHTSMESLVQVVRSQVDRLSQRSGKNSSDSSVAASQNDAFSVGPTTCNAEGKISHLRDPSNIYKMTSFDVTSQERILNEQPK